MAMRPTQAILLVLMQIVSCVVVNSQLQEGQRCTSSTGRQGTCLLLDKCPLAIQMIRTKNKPQTCGFSGKIPIVCCESIMSRMATIAARKCLEYKTKTTPTTTTTTMRTTTTTISSGKITPPPLDIQHAIGGYNTLPLEYPHMAILGYGTANDIKWLCGGSLISETFILTAAHCIYSKYGNVSTIKLGVHQITAITEHIQTFSVKKTFQYPEYSATQNYHDVALIELDRPANINTGVKPACLHTSQELSGDSFTATGWGATELYGDITEILQKVYLQYVPYDTCAKYYKSQNRLAKGLVDEWQICADGGKQRADTCQGDSGGPLHLENVGDSLYTVVGITSFGIKCALVPAVYSRVSYYVPWIESVVWPN